MGEPDAAIINPGKYIIWVELETKKIECLENGFFDQFYRFIKIGEEIAGDPRKKFHGHYIFSPSKRVRAKFRTRKFIYDQLSHNHEAYYLVISKGLAESVSILHKKLINKNAKFNQYLHKIGWLSYSSINRFSRLDSETKKMIQFNLRD